MGETRTYKMGKRTRGARQALHYRLKSAEARFRELAAGDMSPSEIENTLANEFMHWSANAAVRMCEIQHRRPKRDRFTALALHYLDQCSTVIPKSLLTVSKIMRFIVTWAEDGTSQWSPK